MKIKGEFIIREVAGQNVVIPSGENLNLNVMITLNETGAFLWKLLETETSEEVLMAALQAEYDVDEVTVRKAVQSFVRTLKDHDLLA